MLDISSVVGALSPLNIILAVAGVAAGTVIGAIPGLTATMAVAVLVPLTFGMEPQSALILMGAIYTGAIYGGAYSAILLNTPGTPSAIATTFDGYPMAKRGDGSLAVTLSCLASVIGGLVGVFFLMTLSPPLAQIALAFGPVEYFWLAMFGLSMISALSENSLLKGLIGACFGLMLSFIGVAEISADVRFIFGLKTLLGGIDVVSALIGLYCVPVLIDLVATRAHHLAITGDGGGIRLVEALKLVWQGRFNLLRSSVIGTLVGILPGAGGSVASLVSYSEVRRSSKTPERFGQGDPQGVLASESANNATVGGGFIPTLVLGIPGTPPDAVILGALLVQGVKTGPGLFTSDSPIIGTFMVGLLLATILMLPIGLLIGRYAYKTIISLPKAILAPAVTVMTIIGSFAIRNNTSDIVIMVVLGGIAWLLKRFGFPPSPIVLGLILGRLAEQGFVQGWTLGTAADSVAGAFFGRPISLGIMALIVLTLVYPQVMALLKRRGGRNNEFFV